jgi:hypothetical protein
MLLGELNELKLMVTKELIFFKAGPEFLAKEGHLMVVCKPIYSLRGSRKAWHDLLYDNLTEMGFKPTEADLDIWIQDAGC